MRTGEAASTGDDLIIVTAAPGGAWHQVEIASGGTTITQTHDPTLVGEVFIDDLDGTGQLTINGTHEKERDELAYELIRSGTW